MPAQDPGCAPPSCVGVPAAASLPCVAGFLDFVGLQNTPYFPLLTQLSARLIGIGPELLHPYIWVLDMQTLLKELHVQHLAPDQTDPQVPSALYHTSHH